MVLIAQAVVVFQVLFAASDSLNIVIVLCATSFSSLIFLKKITCSSLVSYTPGSVNALMKIFVA